MKFTPQSKPGERSLSRKSREHLHTVLPNVMKEAAHQSDPTHRYHLSPTRDARSNVSHSGAPQRRRSRHSRAF